MMDETGIYAITLGSPGISEEEKNDIRRIANEGFQQSRLAASARLIRSDVEACLECGIKEIMIFTPFNGLHLKYRLKMTATQVLEKTVEIVQYAKKHGATVNFVLEDASRTPLEEILQIFKAAVKAGADRLVIADTVGFLRPYSMHYLVSHVRDALSKQLSKQVPLSVHCHNDFGLATANILAAVEEGVAFVHTCVAGFGERAGVAPLEEVAVALELLYNIDTGLDLKKLYRLSQLAEKSFSLPIQHNRPIIGENAFSYEMGERFSGILSNPMTYEPFPPEIVERQATFFLGRHAEKSAIADRLALAGIKATPMQIGEIAKRIKSMQESLDKGGTQMTFYQIRKLLREMRRGSTEEDFWRIAEQVTGQKPKILPPPST
jgi:isopropylmalate/homocitrate/citramalate synthase